MRAKALIQRTLALGDIEQAISHYLEQEVPTAALGFVDALAHAYAHISKHPGTGSPRYAHELGIPELRCWTSIADLARSARSVFGGAALRILYFGRFQAFYAISPRP